MRLCVIGPIQHYFVQPGGDSIIVPHGEICDAYRNTERPPLEPEQFQYLASEYDFKVLAKT